MKIKIAVGISILTFFVIATATVASYLVIKERNEDNPNLLSDVKSKMKVDANPTDANSETSSLTTAKISEHSSPTDCWITISGKVYNVTKFLDLHPGGALTITPYCGKDATNAFNTRDKNPPQNHTNTAVEMLKSYFVGNVGSAINNSNIATNAPVATKTILPIITQPVTQATNPPLQNSSISLTSAEVATHNNTSNCWLIISNNVYNVTNYLVAHPGGVSAISPYCGKEATQAFQTQGGGGSHSSTAYSKLNSYLVGSIGSTVTTNANTNSTTLNTTTPSTNNLLPASVSAKYPNATIKKIEDDGEEMEIITTQGSCRHIKLNNDESIRSDQSC